MPPASYQQSATPMYPLKPQEVPTIPNSYTDGHGTGTVYPPVAGYPPAQPPSTYYVYSGLLCILESHEFFSLNSRP